MADGELRPHGWQATISDRDQARHELIRLLAPAALSLDATGAAPFRLGLGVARLGPVLALSMSFAMPVTAEVHGSGGYQVLLAEAGLAQVRRAGAEVLVDRDRAAVLSPGVDVTYRHGADFRPLVVVVDAAVLHRELSAMLGVSLPRGIALTPALDVTGGAAASWCRTVRLFRDECQRAGSLLEHPLIAERMRQIIVAGMLLCLPHRYQAELHRRERPAPPASVRRVVAAIEEQPEHPFSVGELAGIGRVSIRALQEGFRRHLGMSPVSYLREVRLARAHDLLRQAHPGQVTVAAVAHRCGFAHLGRFSSAYRARYGSSPSATLRAGA
ncbi:AraC family transcriptional regulator [Actinoplanes sp. N902-109]|uniref:helix-turn-helix transcriptional regulator n=1 Tax=Actinoplanes sp. (strain N902-109) TaxID=649831 RepID=UPI0003296527|nr:AraC family transcriptional regulator [Actinoplanes sp. N902-109]AGL19312.1 transcriptional regulator, AraC family [Actinoplanes sp. N902-109]